MSTQRTRLLALLAAAGLAGSALGATRGNGKIAYDSARNGNVDVFVMEADGSTPVRLTTHSAQDRAPAFSPDGARIAFHSLRNGNADIYLMNADGSGQVRLTSDPANELQPTWSPDGTRLAYAKMNPTSGTHDIWMIRADGTGAVAIAPHAANDIRPGFSPDGTRIVFQSDRDGNSEIFLVPVGPSGATGPAVNLTNNPAEDMDPVFTADGTQVIFMSDRVGLRTRLFKMYTDGTLQTELPGTEDLDKDPAMAPDGTAVVFAAQRGTSIDEIWTLDLTTGTTRRLTLDSFADRSPDWQGLVLQTNHPPLAGAGADVTVSCTDAEGAVVDLDGSGSSDPDDNLAVYEWFTGFGTSSQHLLGTGMHLQAQLAPGTTEITLRVTDSEGLDDTDSMTVTVVDPVTPGLSVSTDPSELWPPNRQMVDVHASVQATAGLCTPVPQFELQSVQVSEESNSNGHGRALGAPGSDVAGAELGTADLDLQLRAVRPGKGSRTYTLTYVLTTGSGAGIQAWATVVVPHDQSASEPALNPKTVSMRSEDTMRSGELRRRVR
ncbi:MAG TPA: PKD domain-containing protein [Candidatus Polarisedimenticolaceae bacterium]|nr:PKD domain-containing protein [Candidatus Polarisedimenticolaceae bacterium]